MKNNPTSEGSRHSLVRLGWLLLVLTGCNQPSPAGFQGYLEGEFTYVSAPLAGRLEILAVQKGQRVTAGAALFTLERDAELAAQREASDRLRSAQAKWQDSKKGFRPTELAALEARLAQARSASQLSKRELTRQETLFQSGAVAASDFDRARLTHQRDADVITELEAQLATARLGARPDVIAGAEAEVQAAQAALARTDWNVAQKTQVTPVDALVYDTLYRMGEYIAAGTPVLTLLPPENLKIRFFVDEAAFAQLKLGDPVEIGITGTSPRAAKINYLSPQPEYTPPILYNRENRAKLVFMVEAVFVDPALARDLHPGQPVDVIPASAASHRLSP